MNKNTIHAPKVTEGVHHAKCVNGHHNNKNDRPSKGKILRCDVCNSGVSIWGHSISISTSTCISTSSLAHLLICSSAHHQHKHHNQFICSSAHLLISSFTQHQHQHHHYISISIRLSISISHQSSSIRHQSS